MTLLAGMAMRNQLYHNYRQGAEKRELEFNLTLEEFTVLTSSNCFYCDEKPTNNYSRKGRNGAYIYSGIDRKDNDKGYFLDNCVACCWECNHAKGNRSYDEFINWLRRIFNCQKSI